MVKVYFVYFSVTFGQTFAHLWLCFFYFLKKYYNTSSFDASVHNS